MRAWALYGSPALGSGGNAGSQAATLMVRALATGDVAGAVDKTVGLL